MLTLDVQPLNMHPPLFCEDAEDQVCPGRDIMAVQGALFDFEFLTLNCAERRLVHNPHSCISRVTSRPSQL